MSTAMTQPPRDVMNEVTASFKELRPQLQAALPANVPVDRFVRTALTSVQLQPELLVADRRSLFLSCLQAATDGLIPDGREGALVVYRTKVKRDGREEWIQKVQWMPMYSGLLKKVRNSEQLASISANVVFEGDAFDYELGDQERIVHKPALAGRGKPIAVYAIAHLKDGSIYREVLSWEDVQRIRASSKAKDGPAWVNWEEEMAKKSAIRRLSKRLPASSDLDRYLGSVPATEYAQQAPVLPPGAQLPDPESLERTTHQLSCAAIAAIRDSEDPAEVQRIWQRACQAFRELDVPVPVDIEAVRNDRLEQLAPTAEAPAVQ
jgi:phage RecT family recombinase